MDAFPGGKAIQYQKIRRRIASIKSSVDHSQGGGYEGGCKGTGGDGKISILQFAKVGMG